MRPDEEQQSVEEPELRDDTVSDDLDEPEVDPVDDGGDDEPAAGDPGGVDSGGITLSFLGGRSIPDAVPVGGLAREPSFRLVELREGADGHLVGRVRRELMSSVYNAMTAQRYAMYEAKQLASDGSLLLLLRPTGTVACVLVSGSGRKAPPRVAMRARRLLRQVLPEVCASPKRRTSRATTAVGRPTKRRTSRAPGRR